MVDGFGFRRRGTRQIGVLVTVRVVGTEDVADLVRHHLDIPYHRRAADAEVAQDAGPGGVPAAVAAKGFHVRNATAEILSAQHISEGAVLRVHVRHPVVLELLEYGSGIGSGGPGIAARFPETQVTDRQGCPDLALVDSRCVGKEIKRVLGRRCRAGKQSPIFVIGLDGNPCRVGNGLVTRHIVRRHAEVLEQWLVERGVQRRKLVRTALEGSQPSQRAVCHLAANESRKDVLSPAEKPDARTGEEQSSRLAGFGHRQNYCRTRFAHQGTPKISRGGPWKDRRVIHQDLGIGRQYLEALEFHFCGRETLNFDILQPDSRAGGECSGDFLQPAVEGVHNQGLGARPDALGPACGRYGDAQQDGKEQQPLTTPPAEAWADGGRRSKGQPIDSHHDEFPPGASSAKRQLESWTLRRRLPGGRRPKLPGRALEHP